MLKKDIKAIKDLDERESGRTVYNPDDYEYALKVIADTVGVKIAKNEEEFVFKNEEDKLKVQEAINYYYELLTK